MSSVAAAADTPEEFAALADEVVEDFMSDAASNEVFSTAELGDGIRGCGAPQRTDDVIEGPCERNPHDSEDRHDEDGVVALPPAHRPLYHRT